MAIKTYLISCLIILANCNARATKVADDCEESETANGGYFASGSAISSQYLLPNGELVTHSKGNSYSSGGIKETFEKLKQEANQYVTKQKDIIDIPNPLPALHTGLDQDFHKIFDITKQTFTLPSAAFNKFESSSQQKKEIFNAGQDSQAYYPQVSIPQTSKVITKKTEYQEKKKVVTHGSSGLPTYQTGNEEIEESQNNLDSVSSGDTYFQHIPSSSFQNVHYQSGNSQKETENLDLTLQQPIIPAQKIQALPLSQTSYSKYETSVKQNSSSQVAPAIPAYIPTGTFHTGIIDFTSNEGQNAQVSNLTPYLGNRVPSKISLGPEKHYEEEKESSSYNENVATFNSQTNSQQKEHKFNAVPLKKVADLPLKIKYTYDGKTLKKYEVYDAGVLKQVPISVEEYDNTLKEIKSQSFTKTSQYGSQSSSQTKDSDSEGYYYPVQAQSLPASNVHTFKKEESQSSHSHQTFTNADSSVAGNVEQFSHLPLSVDSQKQYNHGYVGVIPPVSASQISEEKNIQASHVFAKQPAIVIKNVPEYFPLPSQQSSSNTFHSSSHFSGSNTDFGFSPEFHSGAAFDAESASSALNKLSTLNHNSGVLCGDCINAANLPAKSSYGVATSFSSSSSNINGKKNENRQASITVNDNGKVDTYNVKS